MGGSRSGKTVAMRPGVHPAGAFLVTVWGRVAVGGPAPAAPVPVPPGPGPLWRL